MNTACNNCGKTGHQFSHCKMPVTSLGIIAFRYGPMGALEYLMIRRKETLGYLDFMRGKYAVGQKEYILNMFVQMTDTEKDNLLKYDFDTLWCDIWGKPKLQHRYRSEETSSRDKFNQLLSGAFLNFTMRDLIDESNQRTRWSEPEWGFPKGRRSAGETDYDCAVREFCEETGYNRSVLHSIQNVLPMDEIFVGSNYVFYKHKYFLMHMDYHDTMATDTFQQSEVSCMKWFSVSDCLANIRTYNLEKKRVLTNIDHCLRNLTLFVA